MGDPDPPIGQSNGRTLIGKHTGVSSRGRKARCARGSTIEPRAREIGWLRCARFFWQPDHGIRRGTSGGRSQRGLEIARTLVGAPDRAVEQMPAMRTAAESETDDGHHEEPKGPPHAASLDRDRPSAKTDPGIPC